MANDSSNLSSQSDNLFRFLWDKRKAIFLISLIVAIASTIVSLLIKPLFLSTAIVFPAATSSVSFSDQRNAKSAAMD